MHDQEFNLDRVVDLGIGIHLSELRCRPQHLIDAVETVFGEPRFKVAVARQQSILERYDGPRTGARLINEFLGG
jgi:UDP:flavonoid glycosyltransferase YjiC (YdhE family)